MNGYPLPTLINPPNTRCITLELPDDPDHLRAFLGQLGMLTYWWTWERDEQKRGREAAQRWREVLASAETQLDMGSGCPVFDIRVVGCTLQKTTDGGQTWQDVAVLDNCGQTGPAGPAGPAGADGADGASVELQVYFGTIQWRQVGTATWNHLINLSEITGPAGAAGADGASVELRTYFGTLQWRQVGSAVWNHLLSLDELCKDCPDDETPTNPAPVTDGLFCAIAYRVAAEIKRIWDYAYTNPDNVISNLADGVGTTASVSAVLFPAFAIPAAKIGAVAAFVGLLSRIFDDSEPNSFTVLTEYHIAKLIYCELTRRQNQTITNDLLIDIAPSIMEAPDLTARQKVAVIAFILAAPIAAWAWAGAAAAPYPDGSACAGGVCPDDDDDFWCVQLFDNGPLYGDMLAFHPMLQSGMVTLETGWLQSFAPEAYAGVSTFGRPFLPTMDDEVPRRELRMRIRFPRPTRIDRLEFQMLWNQTAPIDGQLLRVWDTNTGTVLLDEPTPAPCCWMNRF